jgi:hypothetical protein
LESLFPNTFIPNYTTQAVTPLPHEQIDNLLISAPYLLKTSIRSSFYFKVPSSFSIKVNGIFIEFLIDPPLVPGLGSGSVP